MSHPRESWPRWDRLAWVLPDVAVGSWWACDQHASRFDRVVHIQSPGTMCGCPLRRAADLEIEMLEGRPLGLPLIERLAEFGSRRGTILVHCTAGQCRSPTAVLVLAMARGMSIGQGMGAITDGMVSQYRDATPPAFLVEVLPEIVDWGRRLGRS